MTNKQIKKHLLLAEIKKLVILDISEIELKEQSKILCINYFPNADKYLLNAIEYYTHFLRESFLWELDVETFITKYKTRGQNKCC